VRLYVADLTPRAVLALANLKEICRTHLAGRYHIEVIDVLAHTRDARADQIVALPTLVRRAPGPRRIVIGDLTDTKRVLAGLGFPPALNM
jgi:circadian clock protein KaiB